MVGRVFDIQRFSTHDGPGIRTTIFLKGCPLHCAWCHNPEGISPRPELSFTPEKCLGCGECVRACRNQAHTVTAANGRVLHTLDRGRCKVCGDCAAACDAGCLEVVGRELSVDELMREVLADRPFFQGTGGGVTLSGGEPLMQIDFAAALLQASKDEGLHCCIETCGFVSWSRLHRVLPLVDLFLYDYKMTAAQAHVRHTGQSNEVILRNLRRLHDEGATIRLQCPLVPGLNDNAEHLAGIAALAASMPRLEGVSLLPYHPLGTSKRKLFGMPHRAGIEAEATIRTTVESWAASLSVRGVRVFNRECS